MVLPPFLYFNTPQVSETVHFYESLISMFDLPLSPVLCYSRFLSGEELRTQLRSNPTPFLVVLDELSQPQGVIPTHLLFPLLLTETPASSLIDLLSFIEPIIIIRQNLSILEILRSLGNDYPAWGVVVTESREVLGVINYVQYCHYLLTILDQDSPLTLQLKELVDRNNDLVQINHIKDEFLQNIGHELKSPLTAILGLATLLKEHQIGILNPRQEHYVNLIQESGQRLSRLVQNIISISQLQAGNLHLKIELINLRQFSQELGQSLKEIYGQKIGHLKEFICYLEPNVETIYGDQTLLRQTLLNLIDNAIKFTPNQGSFGLKISCWKEWINFTIWDTGQGIPTEIQPLLLQKMQSSIEGQGLGLLLTQRLAKAQGGEICFISKINQGSQFSLLLPSCNQGETLKKVILVVDNIPTSLEQLIGTIRQLNYGVVPARSGQEALEKARTLKPFIIFLNPLMSYLAGWDILKLLKQDETTKKIPIVIFSKETDKLKAKQQGAEDCITLPINKKELKNCLNYWLKPHKKRNLTLLRLSSAYSLHSWVGEMLESQIDRHFSEIIYRVLEADTVEQGELLASVWKIDLILFEGTDPNDLKPYLKTLISSDILQTIPLITFDNTTTALANQLGHLAVFPCLMTPEEKTWDNLLQVISIAVGS